MRPLPPPRSATRSSRRAARSGSRTRRSTPATSGARRSCSAARSLGPRPPSIRGSGARLYWSQSRLHTLKGNQDAAARYARKTLELLELGEDVYNTARAHQLLAFIAVERGRGDEALDYVERGLALLGDDAGPVETAQFRIEEARALVLLGRTDEAASVAMTIQGMLAEAEPDDAGRAYTVLGDVYRRVGDNARAREIWELAAELLEREPNPYIGDVYERLGVLLEEEGRTEEALQMLKRAYGSRQRTEAH